MNKFIALIYLFLMMNSVNSLAQDTSAYEIQRNKVNALLAQRSAKFGQYDESLNARTGIFGFQTKRDIKNSNEILREIALTDNDIFTQLKVLMDYKDLQVQEAKIVTTSNSENILGYRRSIKTLQDQNEILNGEVKKAEKSADLSFLFNGILLILSTIFAYLLYTKTRKLKRYEKAVL